MKGVLIVFLISLTFVNSQDVPFEQNYTKSLWTESDTFYVSFSRDNSEKIPFQVSAGDTLDLGTDGCKNLYTLIIAGKDTIKVNYVNTPYRQWHFIPIKSPKGKTIYRLRFNTIWAGYSDDYIKDSKNNIRFEIPEVYELANIIWTLSPSGSRATDLNNNSDYYKKVIQHFSPYLNCPIFQKLDFPEAEYFEKYYDFRENSLCFSFKDSLLVSNGPYYHVYYTNDYDEDKLGGLFGKLSPLVEDFARKSNFKKFYKDNLTSYSSLIMRQKNLMPVIKMWEWLEKNFPSRFDAYKIVFSPLVGGSHSTQKFTFFTKDGSAFRECVMFVNGPEKYNNVEEEINIGLASGTVFTEIDHNYVNPVTSKYREEIDNIFKNDHVWTARNSSNRGYNNGETVFNEYMTHAVFCLYMNENYGGETASYVIDKRIESMEKRRGFIKFREFFNKLSDLYFKRDHNDKVSDLYPQIIEWASTVN